MKIKLVFTIICLSLFAFRAQSQSLKAPKMDMAAQVLKVLNNTKGLGLNQDQESKLMDNNKSFVDQLMNINKSDASDEDKKAGFLNLKEKRNSFLTQLLTQALFQKYTSQVTKGINPLKSKLGLAALAF
ncbi:hypothetical protein SAMN04488519_1114 [Algoriphagus ornithinivorans]|uniref:DUF3347 domain-containing protein n=1 Tax=Algoriphagus ornithinivorans TaxID=226506 RepID=A0A1I5J248_9BACT|nr:hypothetical protein [Algoriphagus ornithinivorans]SFO66700.1 hypothetical protein SAMN04488519_1114 [Algoriphagus ornithinivorans]